MLDLDLVYLDCWLECTVHMLPPPRRIALLCFLSFPFLSFQDAMQTGRYADRTLRRQDATQTGRYAGRTVPSRCR